MRLILITFAACAALFTPALAMAAPRSLEIAFEDYVADYAEEEYALAFGESWDSECDRLRVRVYECSVVFDATAFEDVTLTDTEGDELEVLEEEDVECDIGGEVRRRSLSSRLGRYRIAVDEPECELVTHDWEDWEMEMYDDE